MGLRSWSTSNLEYGRKVLSSGLEGARSGREAFLQGGCLTPFVRESVCHVWKSAVVGACVGALGSMSRNRHRSVSRTLAYGVMGSAVGFGLGLAWKSRRLTESIASGALQSIAKVRDEHWLESHPIDYA